MSAQPELEPDDLTIQRVSSRIAYHNKWMRLREDVIQRPDGSQGIYSYVEKPDFALIIPVERNGFHLVEQYRYPVSHRSWEFPQGTPPNGEDEDPATLARRELVEETGLRAGRLHRLGYLYPAKGMSSQAFTVFVADHLEAGPHSREHEEQDMRQHWFSQGELEDMIRSGIVTDDSTIAAYTLYLLSDRNRTPA
ncbi:MAG: NUDIX hydrolase [Pseudonocardiales bacterium]|nr:NUDIX hydrolase [Pseudonocardiales bacterium]